MQDDSRICKFATADGGPCFKNAHCQLEHRPPLEDGWTRDKLFINNSIKNELTLMAINEQIIVAVIHIEDYRTFYGHLISSGVGSTGGNELKALVEFMNKPQVVNKHRPYSMEIYPALGELVLAKWNDGMIYRAYVIGAYDSGSGKVTVIFVDYGNTSDVLLRNLYYWEPSFADLPFQAVKFVLAGIESSTNEKKMRAKLALKRLIFDRCVNVQIVENRILGQYLVTANIDGDNVADCLVRQGLAQKINQTLISENSEFQPA